ncbi:MAG: TM2 domain-containing protein [Gemmatimonadales bacterium]
MNQEPSDKSRGVTILLAAVLGPFGAHRFYTGHRSTGVLMAATLGGLGIWYLYDLILVSCGAFRDAEGRLVSRWEVEPDYAAVLAPEVFQELDALRAEVAELAERVDFAERLLAKPRQERIPDGGA